MMPIDSQYTDFIIAKALFILYLIKHRHIIVAFQSSSHYKHDPIQTLFKKFVSLSELKSFDNITDELEKAEIYSTQVSNMYSFMELCFPSIFSLVNIGILLKFAQLTTYIEESTGEFIDEHSQFVAYMIIQGTINDLLKVLTFLHKYEIENMTEEQMIYLIPQSDAGVYSVLLLHTKALFAFKESSKTLKQIL